jgi:hypothetical protein
MKNTLNQMNNQMNNQSENQEWYITPAGIRMEFIEFTPHFIETLEDPLDYFFTRYDILEYIDYFKKNGIDITIIKIMEEDNIRNLPMDPLDHYDIIQFGQMLRRHDIAG